jgi:aspartokinase-like uncharacterized kinase
MWVVKLGGSLAGSERLREWLAALAGQPGLVLVPGGGPFADAVRAAQGALRFDDATAHHLAMLAMEQYGRALCALQPGLAPAANPERLTSATKVEKWLRRNCNDVMGRECSAAEKADILQFLIQRG